jgi:GNAT superfamily N-acetyltransferase
VTIRLARPDDLPKLQEIERAAGELFREVGMPSVADDEPSSIAELAIYQDASRAWVSVDSGDEPVAYLLLDVLDGEAHIEQVSVHPAHGRQGLGKRLIDVVATWAVEHGFSALTLTTFVDVAWNGPYYSRLGFRPVEQLSPGLRRIREHEAARGLDTWPRMAMRRELRAPAGSVLDPGSITPG